MGLTKEQLEVVRNGQAVRLKQDGTELVVMRADIFERARHAASSASKVDFSATSWNAVDFRFEPGLGGRQRVTPPRPTPKFARKPPST